MEQNIKYEWIPPGEFLRHPLHQEMLLSPEEKNQTGYKESCNKYGKWRPVLYIELIEEFIIDGIRYEPNKKYTIDGWGYITDALEQGIPLVLSLKLVATTKAEIMQVIAEANSTYHTSYQSIYKMAEGLYSEYSKGKGYRSDLEKDVAATEEADVSADATEDDTPAKPLTIYELIGQMMGGLPGTRIKHILFVGRVNPLHLQRMDVDRISLHTAYLSCKKEISGELPEPPSVQPPVYVEDMTDIPHYVEPSSSANAADDEEICNDGGGAVADPIPQDDIEADDDRYIVLPGICMLCKKATKVKILKTDLPS